MSMENARNLHHLKRDITNSFNDTILLNVVCQAVLAQCVRRITIDGDHIEHL